MSDSNTTTTVFKTILTNRQESPIVIEGPLTQLTKFFTNMTEGFVPNIVDVAFGLGTIVSLIVAV